MGELRKAGMIREGRMVATGRTVGKNLAGRDSADHAVIRTVAGPMRENTGFMVMSGNLFDSAVLKTSVISDESRARFLSEPGRENIHAAINSPELQIDANCILFIRGVGCVGHPGSAAVVNMQPPDRLLGEGLHHCPRSATGASRGPAKSPRSSPPAPKR